MLKLDQILCPTDLTPESDEALRYALAFAHAYKAKLILLYCRKPGSLVEWSTSTNAARLFQQALFTHLDAGDLKALEWEPVIAEADDVGRTIVDEASKRSADLIVMRSRRRPHAAALLGSTAETVTQIAPCLVLVTHPVEREWVSFSTCEIDLHRVLIAHDFSGDSEVALSSGLSVAQGSQAEVYLLHVITAHEEEEPEVAWSHVGLQSLYETVTRRLKETVPKEFSPWSSIVTAVGCGRPADEILAYAKEHEIDLICIGASGTGLGLGRLFGSTVDRVLRRAPCPVLVARSVKPAAVSTKAA